MDLREDAVRTERAMKDSQDVWPACRRSANVMTEQF